MTIGNKGFIDKIAKNPKKPNEGICEGLFYREQEEPRLL